MSELAVTNEARLHEALNREGYYQQRCEALAQHLINRDRTIADLKAKAQALEVDLKAEIASLQHSLAIAADSANRGEEKNDGE